MSFGHVVRVVNGDHFLRIGHEKLPKAEGVIGFGVGGPRRWLLNTNERKGTNLRPMRQIVRQPGRTSIGNMLNCTRQTPRDHSAACVVGFPEQAGTGYFAHCRTVTHDNGSGSRATTTNSVRSRKANQRRGGVGMAASQDRAQDANATIAPTDTKS